MKKLVLIATLVAAGVLSAPTVVKAADGDTDTSKTSTATVDVTTDPNGILELTSVPSFTFATKPTSNADLQNTNGDGQVVVTDNRGTGAGWSLSLSMGAFDGITPTYLTWSGNQTVANDAGNIAPAGNQSATQVVPGATDGEQQVTLETAATGTGTGKSTLTMANVTLKGVTAPAITKSYTSILTWSLGDTQTAN